MHGTELRRAIDTLSVGSKTFHWQELWEEGSSGRGWSHSGIAVLADRSIVFAHPEGHRLVQVLPSGTSREIETPLTEMHSIVPVREADEDLLWVADNGHRYTEDTPEYGEEKREGRVVALSLDGRIRREIQCPPLPEYENDSWSPTSVSVDSSRGDVWVADGYGKGLVHRFNREGALVLTLDGQDSGKRFSYPHGLFIRHTTGRRELYIADRANKRLVVYTLDGQFQRVLGEAVLNSPSAIAELDGKLLVTELFGSIAQFHGDRYEGHMGQSNRDHHDDAWPNIRRTDGSIGRPCVVQGVFNSPHGIAAAFGEVFITEWMIGGRIIRLS